jgi:hypothetical protein
VPLSDPSQHPHPEDESGAAKADLTNTSEGLLRKLGKLLPESPVSVALYFIATILLIALRSHFPNLPQFAKSVAHVLTHGPVVTVVCVSIVIVAVVAGIGWLAWLFQQGWLEKQRSRSAERSLRTENDHEMKLVQLLLRESRQPVSPTGVRLVEAVLTRSRNLEYESHRLQMSHNPRDGTDKPASEEDDGAKPGAPPAADRPADDPPAGATAAVQ